MTVVNSFSEPLQGTLKLTGPGGDTLALAPGGTDKVSIPGKKSQKLTFILGPQNKVDFNEYSVHAILTDDSGKVLAQESVPLDLPLTQYTRQAVPMNGSLDVWKSAYPNHLRVGSKGLDPKNLSATLYTLYDDLNYYFLVRVTDDIQNQTHTGTDLWQGDSIQVSFDPKHEKTGGAYGPNDIELGFALASGSGKLLSVPYVSPVKNIMDKIHYNVIRDETQKTTTYLVCIPFDQLNGLTSKEGLVYGFNAAVHDSDRSFVREHMLELTEGTSAKDPSKYYDWVLLKKN
jgi:hypothetical protein